MLKPFRWLGGFLVLVLILALLLLSMSAGMLKNGLIRVENWADKTLWAWGL